MKKQFKKAIIKLNVPLAEKELVRNNADSRAEIDQMPINQTTILTQFNSKPELAEKRWFKVF
jgi:hypothetical protein